MATKLQVIKEEIGKSDKCGYPDSFMLKKLENTVVGEGDHALTRK